MLKKLNLIQIQTILSAMQIEDFAAGKDIDPRCCVKAMQLPSPRVLGPSRSGLPGTQEKKEALVALIKP